MLQFKNLKSILNKYFILLKYSRIESKQNIFVKENLFNIAGLHAKSLRIFGSLQYTDSLNSIFITSNYSN